MRRLTALLASLVLGLAVASPVTAGGAEQFWYSKDYATTVPCSGEPITWHLDIHATTVRHDDPVIGSYISHDISVAHGYGVGSSGEITYRLAFPMTSTDTEWSPTAQTETLVSRTMYIKLGEGPVVAYTVAWHFTWVDGVLVSSWATDDILCP